MSIFNISVVLNLYFMVLLQSCRMSYADQVRWQSKTIFGVSERTSLEAMLESSATSLLVQGGNKINFNLTVSYRREEVSNKSVAEVESAVESYCQYVQELKNKDIYVGGEIIVNCTNVTKTVDSNYTCNSSDGVSCIFNFTRNSTAFFGNSSYLNETRNVTSHSLIVMKAQRNVTSRLCVNVTTPLVKVDPVVNPPSHFNLSHQNLEIEVELPAQFHIESIENLALSHQFDNITLNCTEYVVNSSYTKNPSKPKIKLQVQFANISWNGSMVVSAMVTERVLPRQFLNVTANVTLSGVTKSLWIGSYTVPGLWFKNMEVKTTSFRETLGNLLTDEEEVVIETSVVIPSVTTNIEAIIALPVFAGSLPVKVISARLSNVQGNIQSSNLRLGSSIGSTIVLREVVPLDPAAPTLVKFDFGRTFNPPGVVNSSVTLQVTGKVDSVGRSDSYVPNSLGNISAWIVYTTAFGQENISSPQWIELELGQPQIKYEINFVKDNGEVEGGDEIGCLFQFFNPAFATEAGDVILDVVFDSQDIMVINSSVAVCNISLDSSSPSHCQNITAWSLLLSITNTNSSFHIQFTNLTAGFGVFGEVVGIVLKSVPASEQLRNEANFQYDRQRWLSVRDQKGLIAVVKPILMSSAVVVSSSVYSTSQTSATIGEKVTFRITGTVPITTNRDFAIIIGDGSISYGSATFLHVGDNLMGRGLTTGTGLNVTSGLIPEAATTFSSAVLVGQFGDVYNTGNSSADDAAMFTLQVSFFIRNIVGNFNNRVLKVTTTIYHFPNRRYKSDKNFKILEPQIVASVVASPAIDVQQNSKVSFTATIVHNSPSQSDAFNVLVQLSVPHPHLILTGFTSNSGSIRSVPGNLAPEPFLSADKINSLVIVYENDVFQRNSGPVEIKYEATTSSTLPASEIIDSSIVMFYTSLPKTLNQSLARKYSFGPRSEAPFLTFRPDPYLTLTFESENVGQFDSGDVLNFTIVVKNVGVGNVKPKAYDVKINIPLSKTFFKDSSWDCNQGIISSVSTGTFFTVMVEKSILIFNEELNCNLTTTLNTVAPSQIVELQSNLFYQCLPTSLQNLYNNYNSRDQKDIAIKPLTVELYASRSTSQVFTGDTLEFTVTITLPEVTTNLKVEYNIPTIASNARGRRLARQTRLVVLNPVSSQTTFTNGRNLIVSRMIEEETANTYAVKFTSITNVPDNLQSSEDLLAVKAKFLVVNQPLILSGRDFDIFCTVHFSGGTVSQTTKISIVGPLLKPLLKLAKSFQVIDSSLDSPSGIFYVNISHSSGSLYDAYDVNVSDTVEGMDIIREKEFPGIVISAPTDNKYEIYCNIPVIAVGQTVHFYYKSQFKVKVKTPRYVQTPASLTWRSAQLNSPAYGPEINSDACVVRNDTIREREEPLYGFLAVGAFLGFVTGFVLIIVGVCIFIKCCDKGRLVPYYRIFSGKPTYTALRNEEGDDSSYAANPDARIQQTESVIYIIALSDPKQIEKQLENLDIQTTMTIDHRLEASRQNMFVSAFSRVVGNLRRKRDISEGQSKLFLAKLRERHDEISAKNAREFEKRSTKLKKKMEAKAEMEVKQLDEKRLKEIEEAKKKLDGLDKKKTKEVLNMIVRYYQSLEHDMQVNLQLEHDLEQEKIRKELSVNNRISSKELQTNLVKELAVEAKLSEEDAGKLVAEHLQAIASVEKIHDDEKSRQIMAVEMRLAERKALAQEMRKQEHQEAKVLSFMKEKYENVLENLVNSSQVSEAEATAYREKLLKDVENLERKLNKQRSRQEQNLHDRLTVMKKRKLQEKEKQHQLELKKLEDSRNDFENPMEFVVAQRELTKKLSVEILDLEREIDKNAAEDLKNLRAQFAEEARREYKAKIEKYYKELIRKGLLKDNLAELLDSHDQDVARILETQQAQQSKQKRALEEKLMKRRELLTEKMKAEQKEQEKIRAEEHKVFKNMIDNQVVISEEQKEKILREHEKNMADLESSLTLNKLRQKHMLEQKIEQRRAMKLDKLQQKHENEHKRIKIENVDGTTEEIDLLKKQEMEKLELMQNDSSMENEIEQIRDEMLKARMETLQEHNDRIGGLIAELQIQRAHQIAEINMQQRALGQLQASILDDLDEKGVLVDPETKEILQQHQDQTQQLEKALQSQRERQEQALKDRLREKLKQKEQTLIQEQKDEIARYLDGFEANSGITRFRKTALKARHKSQLDQARQQIEKEIEQSINEIKLQLEVKKLKAIEKQSIQFIAALVKCGRIQEEELDSVLQVLFPTKKPEEIDELLTQIYGPDHIQSSSITLNSSKPSSLEMKVIAQISPLPRSRRKAKPRFEKPEHLDDLPPPEPAANLPPVILQGSKGFNLQSTLQKEDSSSRSNAVPLGKVRLAPIDK